MSEELREQIYNNLRLKETDELLEIWQINNRADWSETAFDVIKEILRQRLVEMPSQDKPVYKHVEEENDIDDEVIDDGDGIDSKFLDKENVPLFYKPQEVLRVSGWLNWAAIGSMIIPALSSLLIFPRLQQSFIDSFRIDSSFSSVAFMLALISIILGIGLQILVVYLPLKALAQILKILMEMEFNSRNVK